MYVFFYKYHFPFLVISVEFAFYKSIQLVAFPGIADALGIIVLRIFGNKGRIGDGRHFKVNGKFIVLEDGSRNVKEVIFFLQNFDIFCTDRVLAVNNKGNSIIVIVLFYPLFRCWGPGVLHDPGAGEPIKPLLLAAYSKTAEKKEGTAQIDNRFLMHRTYFICNLSIKWARLYVHACFFTVCLFFDCFSGLACTFAASKNWRMKRLFLCFAACWAGFAGIAQDNLVNSLSANKSDKAKEKFVFTPVINLETTPVKSQGSSGTCWSYSGNSFLESEMIRNGKKPIEISQIYTARCVYIEKAKNYVRMHGAVSWGDGGALHDVTNIYAQYGALPRELYTGLNYGTTANKFSEMQDALKGMLDGIIKNSNGKLTPNWIVAFTAALDAYLGKVPEQFTYNGKSYTPMTFAKEVVGLNAADYVELGSLNNKPYYQKAFMPVPDNWSFDQIYNVPMNDITDIIDNALKTGYTVGWATDVSEKYFSWKNGVAFVPEKAIDAMSPAEVADMFNGPKAEMQITEDMRQKAFDNYETTDDHGMQIVGVAKDQTGREYYIVKNSWGETNDYKGYLYVTKNFVKYKTTAFLLNKNAIQKNIRQKLGL